MTQLPMTGERFFIYGELPTLIETAELLERQSEFFLFYDQPASSYSQLMELFRHSTPPELTQRYTAKLEPRLQRFADRLILTMDEIAPKDAPTVIISTSMESVDDQFELLSSLLSNAKDPLLIVNTATFTATTMATYFTPNGGVIGFNGMPGWTSLKRIEITHSWGCPQRTLEHAQQLFAQLGFETELVEDRVGLILPRILAMLINEAAFAVMEKVAEPADIDRAVKLGVNYPHGLLEWAENIGIHRVVQILDALYDEYRDPRYRACPLLRQYARAQLIGTGIDRGFFEHSNQR